MKRKNFRISRLLLKQNFKFGSSLFTFYFLLFTSVSLYLPSPVAAHRFHTTLTRIDYNAEEKLFEISIKIFTHDLAPLLERRSGKKIDLEKSADADKLILDYLNENFVLTDKKDEVKNLKWIGKEIDADSIQIYAETSANENPEGYKLKNTLFFEISDKQTNLVVCRYGGKNADLMFKVGDKFKEIKENKAAAEK